MLNLCFRCLSNGEVPPTKERLEYPPPETNTGLTQGMFDIMFGTISQANLHLCLFPKKRMLMTFLLQFSRIAKGIA